MLCNYHWILNTHNKTEMIRQYNIMDWKRAQDMSILRAIWDPKNANNAKNYMLEVLRDKILEDSL